MSLGDTYEANANSGRTEAEQEEIQYEVTYKTDGNGNVTSEFTEAENQDSEEEKKPDSEEEKKPVKENQETSEVDSQTEAEKEYIAQEFKSLTGEVDLVPTTANIKLKVCNTVEMLGFGSYLSGNYFITAVKRQFSSNGGYSHSIEVLKNGFGSLKKETETDEAETREEQEEVEVAVEESEEE